MVFPSYLYYYKIVIFSRYIGKIGLRLQGGGGRVISNSLSLSYPSVSIRLLKSTGSSYFIV